MYSFRYVGEKWQYVILPKNPQLTGEFAATPMGTTGFATSGGHIYNHLSNPDGSVAWWQEIESLDLSMGHSDPSATYHYHGVSTTDLKWISTFTFQYYKHITL